MGISKGLRLDGGLGACPEPVEGVSPSSNFLPPLPGSGHPRFGKQEGIGEASHRRYPPGVDSPYVMLSQLGDREKTATTGAFCRNLLNLQPRIVLTHCLHALNIGQRDLQVGALSQV